MYTLDSVLKLSYQTSGESWQQKLYPSNLENKLIYAFKKKLFVDADISVQNHVFKAHKCILAFYSTVFQKIFFNEKSPSSSVCIINEIDPSGFKTLLRTIYHSTVPLSCTGRSILYACDAAEKLNMAELKEELMKAFIMRFPSHPKIMEVFWTTLEISQSLKLYEIKEALFKYAEKNPKNVLESESILTAKSDIIKLVLRKPNVPDSMKLETIARLCARKSKILTQEKSGRDLLSCVNFRNLTPVEFYGIVSKHDNFIDLKDAFDILIHLVEPTACCLPSCCTAEEVNSDESLNLQQDESTSKFANVTPKTRSLRECFMKMFSKDTFVDVHLFDKDKQTVYKVHSLILALGSPVLASMLYGPSANKVICTESNSQDLKRMVWSFYEFDVKIPLHSCWLSILQTFDTAWMYGCRNLQKKCKKILRSTRLTTSIFWTLMDKATHLEHSPVETYTLIQYGQLKTNRILDNYKFFRASKNSVIQILKLNRLNATEFCVLNRICEWLEKNCEDFTTEESKRELLKYIRFKNLSDEEFYTFLKKSDKILSPKDSLDIFSYLCDRSQNRLPNWCYTGPLRGFYYKRDAKIGTAVVIKKDKALGCRTSFRTYYTAELLKANKECEIQYLELIWRVKVSKKEKFTNRKCSITITFRPNAKTLSFVDIDMQKLQRIMIPVFFPMKVKNPTVHFDIDVKMSAPCRVSFPTQNILNFENMKIKANPSIYCISDAVVDDWTSEQFHVHKRLLQRFPNEVTTTEKWCN